MNYFCPVEKTLDMPRIVCYMLYMKLIIECVENPSLRETVFIGVNELDLNTPKDRHEIALCIQIAIQELTKRLKELDKTIP